MAHDAEKSGEVALRPFAEKDFEPLADVIRELWHAEDGSDAAAAAGARHELAHHLANAGRAMVAEDVETGRPLGVALVQGEPDDDRWLELARKEAEALLASDEPTAGLEESIALIGDERRLMDASLDADENPDEIGELQLLVVDSAARGRHVGSRLMRDALDHMAGEGLTRFRLSTDSSCDWEFYEHIGLRRVAEGTSGDGFRIYVYEGDL